LRVEELVALFLDPVSTGSGAMEEFTNLNFGSRKQNKNKSMKIQCFMSEADGTQLKTFKQYQALQQAGDHDDDEEERFFDSGHGQEELVDYVVAGDAIMETIGSTDLSFPIGGHLQNCVVPSHTMDIGGLAIFTFGTFPSPSCPLCKHFGCCSI
jgi:hypothetical protein